MAQHHTHLARILAALFFWALCYKLVSLKLMDSLTLPDVVDAVKHLLLFHHEEHSTGPGPRSAG